MDVVEENRNIIIGKEAVLPGEKKLLKISIDRSTYWYPDRHTCLCI